LLPENSLIDPEGLAAPDQTGYARNIIDNDNVEVECDGGSRMVLIGEVEPWWCRPGPRCRSSTGRGGVFMVGAD